MPADSISHSALDLWTSRTSVLLLAITAGAFAWYVPHERSGMAAIYNDFRADVPLPVSIARAVPTAVIVAVAVIAVGGSIVVQIRSRSKVSASLFHLLLIITFVVMFLAYREVMG